MLWLLAAALLVVTAISLFTWPQWWWAAGAGAIVVSQVVIVTSWGDARYGTIANGIVLVGVALGFLSQGPWSFRARFHGQIRSGPDARCTGEQYNFYDQPSRLFLMNASMFGIPFRAFHRFIGPPASMRVKVASVVTMVDAKGPEMDEAETVTLFNDLCVFALGALIDRRIQWQEIDPHTVSASFTNVSHCASRGDYSRPYRFWWR